MQRQMEKKSEDRNQKHGKHHSAKSSKLVGFQKLRTLHDELMLKAHLFKMDTQQEWNKLEEKWQKINQDIQPAKEASKESFAQVGEATELLMEEIAKGYRKIKKTILH